MIDLTVKTLDSQNHVFSLEDDQITVRGFKEHIAESVAVPADSQRLIYCGRVLQDEKKLNDYDVNGKVIHLVQRAPPQPGQHGNDGGQTQGQRQGWQNSQRPHYRVTRTQMHGNAMYLGAMSVPAEIVEGHGIPQLSNSLSGSRLSHAGRMLDRVNEVLDRLDDPSAPPLHPPPESNQSTTQQQHHHHHHHHQQQQHQQQQQQQQQQQPQQSQESEIEQNENNDLSRDDGARLAEAAAAAITAALSAAGARAVTLFRGSSYNGGNARTSSDTNEHQSDAQPPQSQSQSQSQAQSQSQPQAQPQPQAQSQQQSQQQAQATTDAGATSSNAGQSRRTQQQDLPRPPQMAELLQRLCNTQDRLRPYLERYCMLTLLDPSLPPGSGPNTVEESQRIVDGVSEILHLMSHSCHALSDIIIDMSQPPPRNLRCRPIIVQHSAILQPGIPIQVEAHISLNGRSANNNNSNDEATESGNQAQSDNAESATSSRVNTEEGNQERESGDNTAQSQAERSQQDQSQSPFVFNLPNNVEVLMEVSSSESNIDAGSSNEQNAPGSENNNNARRTNVFPFGTPPPPYFMRNFMQAVAGHMVHGGITTTTISTRNPPVSTVGAQQGISTSMDSGSTNTGQSTQARSNTGTHPTTATQTRSTSRPHVFHHHAHPMGLGMSIGLGLDFDPYLPCNSHHVYRSPNTTSSSATGVTTSSQTTRTASTATADAQNQTNQTATTSTTTNSATSTNTTSATNAESANNALVNLLQQILNQSAGGQSQPNISINSNAPLMESLGNIMQMLGNNIHVGFLSDSSIGNAPTLADLFEGGGLSMDLFTSHESGREENFLVDLFVLLAQSMTLDGLVRVRLGQWEPIARLRRPLEEFLGYTFANVSSPEALQEQATERLLSQLRPHIQNLLASEEDTNGRSGSRVDVCATIESLIARHARNILRILFDTGVDDARFGQDILNILINMCSQICTVLRYSLRGGQAGLEAIATRFMRDLMDGGNPALLQWVLNGFITHLRTYFLCVPQPPDSEIIPLLVYRDASTQASSVSSASTRQSTQAQPEDEPMEIETLEQQQQQQQQQQPARESSIPEDREEVPETFPGHEALPSDWMPIIARDGVRQRRQLQMQGVTPNSGVTTFSDAYLGGLPSKRRKLIEQQKPRLLVSPTPNHHSTIAASMERLVREGVGRAGVEEVEGAAVAVAADPAVRRAFGQAIRDCLNPCRYGTPDFPDPLRFPNATKYFADQDRPPK
ncbi:large proline-rich protein BAG6 isoform X2 [Solenopsis invicta]|uniref:large proline-rich protein BAG6 isoform X2 n=1 Tax=Solenopsis invicta TaxID=13686 RepID=UPI00193CD250|nr:large proline-rich protein BAG6 isoform X2 [Solenopsis invicta]